MYTCRRGVLKKINAVSTSLDLFPYLINSNDLFYLKCRRINKQGAEICNCRNAGKISIKKNNNKNPVKSRPKLSQTMDSNGIVREAVESAWGDMRETGSRRHDMVPLLHWRTCSYSELPRPTWQNLGCEKATNQGSSRGDTVLPATGACRRGQGMSFFSALEVRPAWAVTRGKINMAVLTLCALKTLQLIRNW